MKLGSGLIYHHHRHRHSHSLGSHQLGKMICTKIGLWHMIFRIGLGQTHFEPKMCQTHIEPKSIFLLMLAALYSLLGFSGQLGVLTGSSVVFVVFVTGCSVVFVFVLFEQGCITCMICLNEFPQYVIIPIPNMMPIIATPGCVQGVDTHRFQFSIICPHLNSFKTLHKGLNRTG